MNTAIRLVAVATMLATGFASADLAPAGLIGTWQLVSRTDRNESGAVVPEPSLGKIPAGYLIYDNAGHVSAQLMAENRASAPCETSAQADTNNVAHVGGYDAYFGRFEVDAARHLVTHILEGALSPADVDRRLTRRYSLEGETLTLQMEPGGEHYRGITRTLVLRRVSR